MQSFLYCLAGARAVLARLIWRIQEATEKDLADRALYNKEAASLNSKRLNQLVY